MRREGNVYFGRFNDETFCFFIAEVFEQPLSPPLRSRTPFYASRSFSAHFPRETSQSSPSFQPSNDPALIKVSGDSCNLATTVPLHLNLRKIIDV